MEVKLSKGFRERLDARFSRYSFEVGILEDKPHRNPMKGERGLKGKDVISSYAGGPVRKTSRNDSDLSLSDVSKENSKRLGFNYLTKPFKDKKSDIIKFTEAFFKMIIAAGMGLPSSSNMRRCENLVQAIVRNPILRGEYGKQSALTKKIKGFDRPMIDTAQLFKNIKAKALVKRSV